jgi:predicted nucleotidyltransferase
MGVMPTLLQSMNEERAASAERLRLEVRQALRAALTDLLPGRSVTVFGSLTQTGRFTEYSDVDLALRELPADLSLYQLIALLSERLGRRVDVVMLCETRLRDKIAREGEVWIP